MNQAAEIERDVVRRLVSGYFALRIGGEQMTPIGKTPYNGTFPAKAFARSAELPMREYLARFLIDGQPKKYQFLARDDDHALEIVMRKAADKASDIKDLKFDSVQTANLGEHQRVWKLFFAKFDREWVERPRSNAA